MCALSGAVLLGSAFIGDRIESLGPWAYLGAFAIELMDAATPFIPTPAHAYIYSIAAYWNPLVIALLAALGSTLGETVGYMTGVNGQRAVQQSRLIRTCAALFGRWEGRLVMGLAAIPLPIYVAGVWAGAFGISYRRFLLYAFCGKLVLFLTLTVLGFIAA